MFKQISPRRALTELAGFAAPPDSKFCSTRRLAYSRQACDARLRLTEPKTNRLDDVLEFNEHTTAHRPGN